ncbi:hypothetical protein Ctob_013315 [Chrysochromulina tobinii]|uniref:Uncharacterized protein n=1 Tax=Chrysochromulina tobinii TaxID=1460289 RepID=A0A0M0JRB3_9EUKA|nr:hypothetical protein Ctob_013315 [Chrysochromulina tobinii]|eukprot:KOO28798.1 hypothetical protein Ctob_013315 [Chrysochromulina sp. CCMP291]
MSSLTIEPFVAPPGWDYNSSGRGQVSPTGSPKTTPVGATWGHWMADGMYGTGDLPESPLLGTSALRESKRPSSPRSSTAASSFMRTSSSSAGQRPKPMSPFDGAGFDNTAGCPRKEGDKPWSKRSMSQMSDYGTIPSGLPLGLTDSEKKLWLALYVKARELINENVEGTTVRVAVLQAIDEITEKHSLEFRFGHRWQTSLMSCLAMRQNYRSSDVYS